MAFVNIYTVLGNYLSSPTYNLTAEQILYFRVAGLFGMLLSPLAGLLTKRFQGGLLIVIFSLSSMGFVSDLSLLVMMSVCFVIGIAISVPSLVSLGGQLGGKARGIYFYF